MQSGFGKKIENWVGRELAYPDNVLHLATECSNRGHSATFPVELPAWFIKLFTQPSDVVLDPFLGSGTTAVAAKQLGRRCIGIEINPEYIQLAQERLDAIKFPISPPKEVITNKDTSKVELNTEASPLPLFTENTNIEGDEYYESVGT